MLRETGYSGCLVLIKGSARLSFKVTRIACTLKSFDAEEVQTSESLSFLNFVGIRPINLVSC